jgi:integrase/recombinase XerC/integrase/recombinase XerD
MDEKDLVLATTNWIDKWLEAERVNGAAENTINAYRRGLHRFLGWLAEQGITQPNSADIAAYRDSLKENYSNLTVNLSLSAVRSFYRYLLENGAIGYSPAEGVRGIRGGKREHKRSELSDSEVLDVLDTCDDTPQGIRDRAILTLMAYCGLRTIEVQRANLDGLKVNGRMVLWVQGKGHREADEFVVIPRDQEPVMRRWLAERKKLGNNPALFVSLSKQNRGERLTTRAISLLVKEHYHQALIFDDTKTTHSLRHSAITSAIRNGATPLQVQAMARHNSFNTTLGYIHEVSRLDSPAEDLIAY